ncbi:serine/threonine-protein kinase [Pseudomonas sp. CCI3.2]|uniref:serine/threonine-protein kinase n=1 Tax=unclassified Pseudomonas TaxID=196821 RepID=UPI002AC978DA|nr:MULTISPECIES: serine/threonine-protein kinase [unclassified Pseudomonas]MEB0079627.1 serine/threonine-protein kinase [Pseudomonas sp. MH10out]MEB0103833.1 serine/threonine-protein kinase [Pseudomonas sp. CCI3.2]MEB0133083.1 serine/threonine-protein kinase [Pseudomonas sp. CCI2.4]MEB0157808.1 serine/threonine-protein kinase [Pseudomonas sp. AH2 (2023)]MEB0169345.1 serine/threonine-protein kinase [Pseudomonas sp. CCC4.4]
MTDAVPPLPDVLAGRYRIERLLGAGGMGLVYRARDLLHEQMGAPDADIAVKILSDVFAQSPDADSLLYSEFALTQHLRHPGVVQVFDFNIDTASQRAFITMELMRGLPLDRLLCERPLGVPWIELRGIAIELLDALAHAHGRGILHGDLKPSNVMLAEDGLRLFDFGLGQTLHGVLPGLPKLRRDDLNAWTPSYAAPELLEGEPLSTNTDVYAVACVLFELAGGKHPFQRLTSIEAREKKLDRRLKSPKHLPESCWPALRTALAFKPKKRSIKARELRDIFIQAAPARAWRWF